jgi:hypothetical protein
MISGNIDKASKDIDSEDKAILYSKNLIEAFESKVDEFNKTSEKKVTFSQIKSIYINAVNSEINPEEKNVYAFARINLFFDMLLGQEPFLTGVSRLSRTSSVGDIKALQFERVNLKNLNGFRRIEKAIDFFEDKAVGELYYAKAEKDIELFDIGFRLNSVEDQLFISKDKKCTYLWEL